MGVLASRVPQLWIMSLYLSAKCQLALSNFRLSSKYLSYFQEKGTNGGLKINTYSLGTQFSSHRNLITQKYYSYIYLHYNTSLLLTLAMKPPYIGTNTILWVTICPPILLKYNIQSLQVSVRYCTEESGITDLMIDELRQLINTQIECLLLITFLKLAVSDHPRVQTLTWL